LATLIWTASVMSARRSAPPLRAARIWIICAVIPSTLITVFAPPDLHGFAIVFALTPPAAVMLGVVRYKVLDIDLIVRPRFVHGCLAGCLIGVYLAAAAAAGPRIGGHIRPALVAAGLLVLALVFVQRRLRRAIDRVFFGVRQHQVETLTDLGGRLG